MKAIAFVGLLAMSLAIPAGSIARADDMEGMDMGAGNNSAANQMGAHMRDSPHMTMTTLRPMTPEDVHRAHEILDTMRQSLSKYQDYKLAEADSYKPFLENIPQEVYHFSNRAVTADEYAGDFQLAHPGSLLYEKKTFGGYRLVGAMYSAAPDTPASQLDEMIPLGLARWHAHTNICVPKGVTEADLINGDVNHGAHFSSAIDPPGGHINHGAQMRYGFMADPRFGFTGTIADEGSCSAVGGNFIKQVFGWMVHVYPFSGDDLKVAFGTDAP